MLVLPFFKRYKYRILLKLLLSVVNSTDQLITVFIRVRKTQQLLINLEFGVSSSSRLLFSPRSSLLSSSSRPSETQTSLSKRSPSGVAKANLNPPADRCCSRRPRLSHQQAAGRTEELPVDSNYARAWPITARLIICDQPHVCFLPSRAAAFCSEAAADHRPFLWPPAANWHVRPRRAVGAPRGRVA